MSESVARPCVCGKQKGFMHYWATNGYASCQKAAKERARNLQSKKVVCPHCQTSGKVARADQTRKDGIHGGKATAAVLTGGASLLATGLSANKPVVVMHCGNCGIDWTVPA